MKNINSRETSVHVFYTLAMCISFYNFAFLHLPLIFLHCTIYLNVKDATRYLKFAKLCNEKG